MLISEVDHECKASLSAFDSHGYLTAALAAAAWAVLCRPTRHRLSLQKYLVRDCHLLESILKATDENEVKVSYPRRSTHVHHKPWFGLASSCCVLMPFRCLSVPVRSTLRRAASPAVAGSWAT